ncbi:MAG: helix-turn-helix transcriptional regulator [Clostridia bacterium]|nr:helix-turn-helix transcriptional regulator [Clostridia bacterium]
MTNAEILGNKLYELRRQAGLSQEEFANKIGVSRQAVSKWERGEALPDTDNLITIARMYKISLDELIANEVDQSTDDTEQKNCEDDDEEKIYYSYDGNTADKKRRVLRVLHALPYPIIVTIAFLLWGFFAKDASGWSVGWTLFITIPVYYSVIDCFRTKRLSNFCYPVFIAFLYCLFGMLWGLWHPLWIMFITIPVYYVIADAIDKKS